ncbi:MAG: coproporphyrinogen III oxidase family protein [Deltaproteobacteria bacterium]|nr:coproporphyrinogen III oxidase family protein [Deltaproteobacteria bacterium]
MEKGDLGGFEVSHANACGYQNTAFPAFDSLYLGGGTPSLLNAEQLTALVNTLRRHFDFAEDTEFTLEANPDDITGEKLCLYRDLGINRLSLGVQSFDEQELIFLQRRHTPRQTMAAIEQIRAAGFDNLGLDLMYGLPGQSQKTWRRTLETALSLAPEHLSCYQLTVSAGETPALPTAFARRMARGEFNLPDEEAQREFFLVTRKFLEDQGYIPYEISNFARQENHRPEACATTAAYRGGEPQAGGLCHYDSQAGSLRYHFCRHNCKYWNHTPYLGLGPAAHSFKEGQRWWNLSSVKGYCAALNAGQAPVAGSECLTPEQLRLEAIYLGFRTKEGVPLEVIQQQSGWQASLLELEQAGLVRLINGRVTATAQGLVVADRLPLRFAN